MALPAYLMDEAQQKQIDQIANRVRELGKLEDRVSILELEINNIYKILERNGIK